MIRRLAAIAAVCAALATGSAALATVPASASPTGPASATAQHASTAAARRCSTTGQNLRVTHNSTETVLTIITRRCGRSYRAWLRTRTGVKRVGVWRTSGQSVVLGNGFDGGWQREPTGGGTLTTHTSY